MEAGCLHAGSMRHARYQDPASIRAWGKGSRWCWTPIMHCQYYNLVFCCACRWVVVMPRYPSPMAPPGTERLVRTLLVAYKGRDQCVPTCKVRGRPCPVNKGKSLH